MLHALKNPEIVKPCLEYGTVQSSRGRIHEVCTASGRVLCRQAVSCLVAPRKGDTVLLSEDDAGSRFILSILLRADSTSTGADLVFDGPVSLQVHDGGLVVNSDEDLTLASQKRIECVSTAISVHADRGSATIRRFSFLGKVLEWQVKKVKSVVVSMEQVCRRLTQHLGQSFRYIKAHEETQAGSARILVEDLMTIHSKNTFMISEEHVTVNAEQIHLS